MHFMVDVIVLQAKCLILRKTLWEFDFFFPLFLFRRGNHSKQIAPKLATETTSQERLLPRVFANSQRVSPSDL